VQDPTQPTDPKQPAEVPMPASDHRSAGAGGLFRTTHWSEVLAAGDAQNPLSRQALAALCETYWYPVYALVRHLGHDEETSRDLTQGFFAHLIEKDSLKVANPQRGTFRSFLKAALRNYIDHERHRAQAQKRGGGARLLSLDFEMAESMFRGEPLEQETPEIAYEKRWAHLLLSQALNRLEREMTLSGDRERFRLLEPLLTEQTTVATYRQLSARLGITESAVKGAVHRMRKRFGRILREQLAQTVHDPDQVDEEVKYLFDVIVS
jgi:RNA polymerase sigma-70 factor (ECF subfamily)